MNIFPRSAVFLTDLEKRYIPTFQGWQVTSSIVVKGRPDDERSDLIADKA